MTTAYNALERAVKAEQAKAPMGIEEALVAYMSEGPENSAGYEWLRKFTDCALAPYGVGFHGSYNPETNQRVITIRRVDRTEAQAKFAAGLLDGVAAFIKPLNPEKPKFSQRDQVGTKVFSVSAMSEGITTAHQMPDGSWRLGFTCYGSFRFIKEGMTTLELIQLLVKEPEDDGDDY